MARPPVEWPIPVYVVELRERVLFTFRLPAAVLGGRIPAPLHLEHDGRDALVSLAVANGRCLKPVGGPASLARDFHLAELIVPVSWKAACREAVRGNYLLHLFTNSRGLRRLVGAALGFAAEDARLAFRARAGSCRGEFSAFGIEGPIVLDRPAARNGTGAEPDPRALNPEYYFVPDSRERVVRAVPVHQYARATLATRASAEAGPVVAAALGLRAGDLVLEQTWYQHRCTHTWSFPPERILIARPEAWRSSSAEPWETALPAAA